jgi:predicted ATPase
MGVSVERHDAIVRSAIEDHDGFVFATGGDAFSAVFRSAQDALAAAVKAQLAITGEEWGEVQPLLVRMGVHTGEAEERDDNYFGPAVNESARLMSAGHGGQILVSETAQQIVGSRLPDGVVLVDLGEHRLKDVDHPIAVYQATHPELAVEFPVLRGWADTRNNLPSQLTSFVGRERELVELEKLLERSRLVTFTGAGGSGKTRLALELAGRQLGSYPDGVWFIDLATVDDPMVIGAAVAATLGVSDVAGQKILDRLIDRLSNEKTLLILDNCEHLIEAAASLTSELLQRTESLVMVATSREPLGITGEATYPVPTLAEADDQEFTAEGPAVRLFVDRAALARPGLHLSGDDIAVVASICRRLDGLPLALELAAARLSVLTPDQLLERLDDRFGVLVGGARDRLPRQQTLTATIDWSYELLSEEEQVLFTRLSVFSGGFTLDAAEGVGAGDGVAANRVLDLLSGLVDKSLLVVEQGRAGGRFALLETMREYAVTRLATTDEDELQRAHAGFFRQLVVSSFDEQWGPNEVAQLDRLEDEWPNIRRALAWHIDHSIQEGLLMAASLYRFAFRRQYRPEVQAWLERFIAADPTPGSARARALLAMGTLNQHRPFSDFFEEAIDLYREFGPKKELAPALGNAAWNKVNAQDWDSARSLAAEAVGVLNDDDHVLLGHNATLLAVIALQVDHDPGRAVELAQEGLEQAQASNSPEAILEARLFLGECRRHAGDLDGAEADLHEALKIEADLRGQIPFPGETEFYLSRVALDQGDVDRAVIYLAEATTQLRRLADDDEIPPVFLAYPLQGWAAAAVKQQRYDVAVVLLGAQTEVLQPSPLMQPPTDKIEAEDFLSKARDALHPESFDQAWKEGTALSGPEALDYAVDQLGSGAQPNR